MRANQSKTYNPIVQNGRYLYVSQLRWLSFRRDFAFRHFKDQIAVLQSGLHLFMFFLTEAPTPNGPESEPGVEEDGADKEEEGSEDEWEQVGPRNKTSITRQADFVRTPITDIFGGHIRYMSDCCETLCIERSSD